MHGVTMKFSAVLLFPLLHNKTSAISPTKNSDRLRNGLNYIWRPSHWYRQGCASIQCRGNNSTRCEFIDSRVSTRTNGNTDPVSILISCCQNWRGTKTWLEWKACTNASKETTIGHTRPTEWRSNEKISMAWSHLISSTTLSPLNTAVMYLSLQQRHEKLHTVCGNR